MSELTQEQFLETLEVASAELEELFAGALESNVRLNEVIEAETPKSSEDAEPDALQDVA